MQATNKISYCPPYQGISSYTARLKLGFESEHLIFQDKPNKFTQSTLGLLLLSERKLSSVEVAESFSVAIPFVKAKLKYMLENPDTMDYLRARIVDIGKREQKLKDYFSLALLLRHECNPFITTENAKLLSRKIDSVKLKDNATDSFSDLSFGLKNDYSAPTFLGIIFEELEHTILKEVLGFDMYTKGTMDKEFDRAAAHEFVAKLAPPSIFCNFAEGDLDKLAEWISIYIDENKLKSTSERVFEKQEGYAVHEHEFAETTIYTLIKELLEQNIPPQDFLPALYNCSLKAITECSKFDNFSFDEFFSIFQNKLNDELNINIIVVTSNQRDGIIERFKPVPKISVFGV